MRERYPVLDGAESIFLQGNEVGFLVIHGFMGTPQSVQYIAEQLHQKGYTVSAPRLKGHGTHFHDLEKSTFQDWFNDVEKAYYQLKLKCNEVLVVGQSMGGALTLHLARRYPEIKGLFLINTALAVPAFDQYRNKRSPRFIPDSAPDIKAKDVVEITYRSVPLSAIHQLQFIMDNIRNEIPYITNPAVCFKSLEDHVVPQENTDYLFTNLASNEKELVILDDSYHVASMDNDKGQIVERISQFTKQRTTAITNR